MRCSTSSSCISVIVTIVSGCSMALIQRNDVLRPGRHHAPIVGSGAMSVAECVEYERLELGPAKPHRVTRPRSRRAFASRAMRYYGGKHEGAHRQAIEQG